MKAPVKEIKKKIFFLSVEELELVQGNDHGYYLHCCMLSVLSVCTARGSLSELYIS